MAGTPYNNLDNTWDGTKRYTAGGDVDILLSNPSDSFLFFTLTTNDTEPLINVRRANPVSPKSSIPMQLTAGERLWLGGDGAYALIEV